MPRCGHLCKLPCHSPVDIEHNKKCIEILDRPCKTHELVPLVCHDINITKINAGDWRKQEGGWQTLAEALTRFECKIKVDYTRPECDHVDNIHCHLKTKILSKQKTLDECKVIVSDYIHPVCNHKFVAPKCFKKREYERSPPKCRQVVKHRRPCGCVISMDCHESIEETTTPKTCQNDVQTTRPRCGHILSLRCHTSRKLKELWEEQKGISASYGRE